MRRGYWLIIIAGIALAAGFGLRYSVSADIQAVNGTLNLESWNFDTQSPIKLTGNWTFYPSQLLTPEDFLRQNQNSTINNNMLAKRQLLSIENSQTSQPPTVLPKKMPSEQNAMAPVLLEVPNSWYNAQQSHYGYGTYILKITGLSAQDHSLGLFQQSICSSSKSYFFSADQIRSQPILYSGSVGDSPDTSIPGLKTSINKLNVISDATHYLLIQVANFDYRIGGLCQNMYLGKMDHLFNLNNKTLLGQGLMIAIVFSIALYAFAIHYYSISNRSSLWLGLWALSSTLHFWTHGNLWVRAFAMGDETDFNFHFTVEYFSLALFGPCLAYFYHHSFKISYLPKQTLRLNFYITLFLCSLILITPAKWFTQFFEVLIAFTFVQLGLACYILIRSLNDRLTHSKLLSLSLFPLFITLPVDLCEYTNKIPVTIYTEYAMIFFIFIQALIHGHRLSLAIQRSQHLSESLAEEVKQQTASLEEKNHELSLARIALEEANQDLKLLSITDGLTGTYNRMYFDRQYLVEWQRSRREQSPLSLILVDIDHFKCLNDGYGHIAGDHGLKAIAQHLQSNFKRASDIVCRYGGEEFVILLPNTDVDQAVIAAQRLREQIAGTPLHFQEQTIPYTVSIGVGGLVPTPQLQPIDLLSAVDKALYKVKNSGRNNVMVSDDISVTNIQV